MRTLNRENIDFELFLKEKIAINCQTEEDCIDFLKMCDEVGIKWGSGRRASSVTYFDSYGKDTCYSYVNSKGDSGLCSGSFGFHSREIGLRIYKWQTLNNDNKETTDDKDKKEMINHPSHYNQGKYEAIDVFKSITGEMTRLFEIKNKNYGNSFSKQFEEYGLTSVCIRLEDKLNRLKSLNKQLQDSQNGITDVNMDDESIKDTLIDLANYSVLAIMELNKGEE